MEFSSNVCARVLTYVYIRSWDQVPGPKTSKGNLRRVEARLQVSFYFSLSLPLYVSLSKKVKGVGKERKKWNTMTARSGRGIIVLAPSHTVTLGQVKRRKEWNRGVHSTKVTQDTECGACSCSRREWTRTGLFMCALKLIQLPCEKTLIFDRVSYKIQITN